MHRHEGNGFHFDAHFSQVHGLVLLPLELALSYLLRLCALSRRRLTQIASGGTGAHNPCHAKVTWLFNRTRVNHIKAKRKYRNKLIRIKKLKIGFSSQNMCMKCHFKDVELYKQFWGFQKLWKRDFYEVVLMYFDNQPGFMCFKASEEALTDIFSRFKMFRELNSWKFPLCQR